MKVVRYPKHNEWQDLLKRPVFDNASLFDTVNTVLKDVKLKGDIAVKEHGLKFDKVAIETLSVSEQELEWAEKCVSNELKEAILIAKENIAKFHAAQNTQLPKIETSKGVTCWQKAKAIDKVGLYIPGGAASRNSVSGVRT